MPKGIILCWNKFNKTGTILLEEPPKEEEEVEEEKPVKEREKRVLSKKEKRKAKKPQPEKKTTEVEKKPLPQKVEEKKPKFYDIYEESFDSDEDSSQTLEGYRVEFELDKDDMIVEGSLKLIETTDIKTYLDVPLPQLRKYSTEDFSRLVDTKGKQKLCLVSKKWECPHCKQVNEWFEDTDYEEGEITVCSKCKKDKPNRLIIDEVNRDSETNITSYKLKPKEEWPTPENEKRLLENLKKTGKKFTSLDDILKKADEKWEESVKLIKQSGGCLMCGSKFSSEGKGCGISLSESACPMVSFSRYYGLVGADTFSCNRRKALIEMLSKLEPCICGLRAVPGYPYNVFRMNASVFNARSSFDNKRDKIQIESEKEHKGRFLPAGIKGVEESMLCHVVPLAANGCWQSPKNIVPILAMCKTCQHLDKFFTELQGKYPDGVPEGK
jgi:hypothetical protein